MLDCLTRRGRSTINTLDAAAADGITVPWVVDTSSEVFTALERLMRRCLAGAVKDR